MLTKAQKHERQRDALIEFAELMDHPFSVRPDETVPEGDDYGGEIADGLGTLMSTQRRLELFCAAGLNDGSVVDAEVIDRLRGRIDGEVDFERRHLHYWLTR